MELRSILRKIRKGQCWHVLTKLESRWIKRHTVTYSISLYKYIYISICINHYQYICVSVHYTWTHGWNTVDPRQHSLSLLPGSVCRYTSKGQTKMPQMPVSVSSGNFEKKTSLFNFQCGGPTNLESVTISVRNRAADRISGPWFAHHPTKHHVSLQSLVPTECVQQPIPQAASVTTSQQIQEFHSCNLKHANIHDSIIASWCQLVPWWTDLGPQAHSHSGPMSPPHGPRRSNDCSELKRKIPFEPPKYMEYPIGSMVLLYMLTLGVYWWDPCYHI